MWAISLSYAFLDLSIYRDNFRVHPDGWKLYFSGGIQAPWQYRIGVWEAVRWMNQWFHLRPYDALTLIDVVCLAVSLWGILRVLHNSEAWKIASIPTQWLATAGVLFLAEYYLIWGHWFQAEDTLPSVLFVTLSLALVYGEIVRSRLWPACCSCVSAGSRIDPRGRCGGAACRIFSGSPVQQKSCPTGQSLATGNEPVAAFLAGCVQFVSDAGAVSQRALRLGRRIPAVEQSEAGNVATMSLATLPFWLLLGLIAAKNIVQTR